MIPIFLWFLNCYSCGHHSPNVVDVYIHLFNGKKDEEWRCPKHEILSFVIYSVEWVKCLEELRILSTMTRKKILHFNFDERFSEDSPFLMKNPKVTNKLLKVKRKWINKCYVIFEVDAKNKVALQTFQTDQKLSRLTLNFPDFGNFAVSLCVCLQKSRKYIICLKFVLHFLIQGDFFNWPPP